MGTGGPGQSSPVAEEREFLNPTWLALTCSRIRTAEPKWLILVSFFSGENTPSTDPSHYLQILPEVCRSVISGPPCITNKVMNYYTACRWFPVFSNMLILPSQF